MGGERLWYERDVERVIVTEEQIATRTAELAKQVSADYQGVDRLLLVSVLKGALMFTADFARALGRYGTPVELEFMAISSYRQGTTSSGVVRILKDLDRDIGGVGASENPVHKRGAAATQFEKIHPVPDQAASFGKLAGSCKGKRLPRRKVGNWSQVTEKYGVLLKHDRVNAPLGHGQESALELARAVRGELFQIELQ